METSILELGSRFFHLHRARLTPEGRVTSVRRVSESLALDLFLDATGALGGRGIADAARAVDRLLSQARRARPNGPITMFALPHIASARDGDELGHVLRRRFGMSPWMLSSHEAARLLYRGAWQDGSEPIRPASVVHLGDATLDFAVGLGTRCEASEAVALGIARLHRAYGANEGGLPAADATALSSLVRLCAGPLSRRLREWGHVPLTATSENALVVRDLGRAFRYVEPDSQCIERVALHALAADVLATSPEALERLGVERSRVASAGTTAVVLDALADLMGQREVRFSEHGVVEGVALETWENENRLRHAVGAESPRGHGPFTVA